MAKIRNGFVSNSSSSSFVVMFPEKIDSKDKLKDLLFDADETELSAYDYKMPISDALDWLWRDIEEARKNNGYGKKRLYPMMESGLDSKHFQWRGYTTTSIKLTNSELQDKFNLALEQWHNTEKRKKLNEIYDKGEVYRFTYADDGGNYELILSQGKAFEKVPHIYLGRE